MALGTGNIERVEGGGTASDETRHDGARMRRSQRTAAAAVASGGRASRSCGRLQLRVEVGAGVVEAAEEGGAEPGAAVAVAVAESWAEESERRSQRAR